MDPIELIAYCATNRDRIFVRVSRPAGWENVPFSQLRAEEVLSYLKLWIGRGQTPVRIRPSADDNNDGAVPAREHCPGVCCESHESPDHCQGCSDSRAP